MSRAFPQVEMEPVYGFFHYVSHVVYGMWFRGEVIGLENLPADGAYLIAASHASLLDPPFVGSQNPPRPACGNRRANNHPAFAIRVQRKTDITIKTLPFTGRRSSPVCNRFVISSPSTKYGRP